MTIYDQLAVVVDIIHLIVAGFMLIGILFPWNKFLRFRVVHSFFCILVLLTQLFFMSCPLTLLSSYLRGLSHPNEMLSEDYNPFIITFLKQTFGLEIQGIIVSIMIFFLGFLGIWTLMSIVMLKSLKVESQ